MKKSNFQNSDSKLSNHSRLESRAIDKNTVLKVWQSSYFSDHFPDSFGAISVGQMNKIQGFSGFYDYVSILYLKSYKSSLHFKILHPCAFSNLSDKIYQQVFEQVPVQLTNSWKYENVFYASNSVSLTRLREEFATEGRFGLRFDIVQFYQSFYLHAMVWIASGSRKNGKTQWDNNDIETESRWASTLDIAVEYCQWKQTRGLPIGSKMIDELAEAFLICMDGIICSRLKDINVAEDQFDIIRCGDNYECYSDSYGDLCKVDTVVMQVIHEFEFNIQYERDWTCIKITSSHLMDLTGKMAEVSVASLRLLNDNVHSMDYGFAVLEFSKNVLKNESSASKGLIKRLIKIHPKSIKYVLENIPQSMVQCISDSLLANIREYIFGGITCQFICILEFVSIHKEIQSSWSCNATFKEIIEQYKDDPFVGIYIGNGNNVFTTPLIKRDELLTVLADQLERSSVKSSLGFEISKIKKIVSKKNSNDKDILRPLKYHNYKNNNSDCKFEESGDGISVDYEVTLKTGEVLKLLRCDLISELKSNCGK